MTDAAFNVGSTRGCPLEFCTIVDNWWQLLPTETMNSKQKLFALTRLLILLWIVIDLLDFDFSHWVIVIFVAIIILMYCRKSKTEPYSDMNNSFLQTLPLNSSHKFRDDNYVKDTDFETNLSKTRDNFTNVQDDYQYLEMPSEPYTQHIGQSQLFSENKSLCDSNRFEKKKSTTQHINIASTNNLLLSKNPSHYSVDQVNSMSSKNYIQSLQPGLYTLTDERSTTQNVNSSVTPIENLIASKSSTDTNRTTAGKTRHKMDSTSHASFYDTHKGKTQFSYAHDELGYGIPVKSQISKNDRVIYRDPMGRESTVVDTDNSMNSRREDNTNQFILNSEYHRNDLSERLMRRNNSVAWQRKISPFDDDDFASSFSF